jgi:lipoate-protein ligase A
MKYLDLTLSSGPENLACDEALLDRLEESGEGEALRFYEPAGYFVVLGYANRALRETRFAECEAGGLPVLRRSSGGGAVLQGPGCLNFALVLRADRAETETVHAANRFIMERHRAWLQEMLPGLVRVEGHTDLSWNGRKFSGNAQRRKRRCLLFHGTFLLGFDLSQVDRWLAHPSAEPDYRAGRRHDEFLVNLPLAASVVKARLREGWGAKEPLGNPPDWAALAASRYGRPEWNLKF